jgi:hypothetical protein
MANTTSFQSSEELFQAVRELVDRLEREGRTEAAAELRQGFGCLNGLTDGWALFLESIERVQAGMADQLERDERDVLGAIGRAAHRAVYQR